MGKARIHARPPRALRPLLLLALIGLAWWFFGNLYEAIVISPNWVVDSPAQLTRLHGFFVVTSPTAYFVPVTLIGILLMWIALFIGRRVLPHRTAILAAAVSVVLVIVTVIIVSVLVEGLFGPGYLDHPEALHSYTWWWNAANVLRMALTATCGILVWKLLHLPMLTSWHLPKEPSTSPHGADERSDAADA